MPRRRLLILPFLVALAVFAGACGGSDSGSGDGAAGAGGPRVITIDNFSFAPETLQAKVGDTITVENKDSAEHSVTAADKSFDTGRFAAGTKTFTLTKAGRFEFVCEIHPFMTHAFIQVAG